LLDNLALIGRYIYFFTFIEYLILVFILFLLACLVFGFRFCKEFFWEYKKGLGLVFVGTVIVYNLIRMFQGLWPFLSKFVGNSLVYLLSFIGKSHLYYIRDIPVLNFNDFTVGIANTCSGIDSILLFTGLYLGILAWDWKLLDKKRVALMYVVGVSGAFLLNIVRIFLLILIGTYISESFALHTFHTNASSFLFIIYFGIFWGGFYKWMRVKGPKEKYKKE